MDRPPCLTCWATGKGCYYIDGFPSCISCAAFGQECTPSAPLSTVPPFLSTPPGIGLPAVPNFVPITSGSSFIPITSGSSFIPAPVSTQTSPPFGAFASTNGSGTSPPDSLALSASSSSSLSPPAGAAHQQQQRERTTPTPGDFEPPPAKKRRPSAASTSTTASTSAGTSTGALKQQNPNQAGGSRTPRKRTSRSPPAATTPHKRTSPPTASSPTGLASSLASEEAIRALAVELFEESFRIRPRMWGFAHHLISDIRAEFERVGGYLKRLGPLSKALVMIRMVYGTTSTMHPSVVRSASKVQGPMLLKGDLTSYGRERSAAHTAIRTQAVTVVRDLGAFDLATYRNMALLGELALLFTRHNIVTAKAYTRASIDHWRNLHDSKSVVTLSPAETSICFSIVCLDATVTFNAGSKGYFDMPQLSDNEVASLIQPTGIPVQAVVRPDYYPEILDDFKDYALTTMDEIIWAAHTACCRMLSILASTSVDSSAQRVPPATYSKVLGTMRRQRPCMDRLREKWGLRCQIEENADDVLSPFTLQEKVTTREYIYRLLAILHIRLAESSHLLPVYEEVANLVWQDMAEVGVALQELFEHPRPTSSLWGSWMQHFYRCLELLPGGAAFLGIFVRDGPGTLESRRFAAENMAQMLKSVAFYGDHYIPGADAAELALRGFDRSAMKTFPTNYRADEPVPVSMA